MKILVNCRGFIGDVLFASSLAKKYHEMFDGNCEIHYNIPLLQPLELLENNPYIAKVWGRSLENLVGNRYDLVVNIPEVDQAFPATLQMQAAGGIEDQSLEFDVFTSPWYDEEVVELFFNLRRTHAPKTKIITFQNDWAWKAYQCTPETLAHGIGAPHRDTDTIIKALQEKYIMVRVGFDRHIDQFHSDAADSSSFARTASLIKFSDYFIGSEGGLSNLAAAVRTRCIITTDFIYQNYGPTGRVRKCDPPMMGPAIYYPDDHHVHLDPCLTDQQILDEIVHIVDHDS